MTGWTGGEMSVGGDATGFRDHKWVYAINEKNKSETYLEQGVSKTWKYYTRSNRLVTVRSIVRRYNARYRRRQSH